MQNFCVEPMDRGVMQCGGWVHGIVVASFSSLLRGVVLSRIAAGQVFLLRWSWRGVMGNRSHSGDLGVVPPDVGRDKSHTTASKVVAVTILSSMSVGCFSCVMLTAQF